MHRYYNIVPLIILILSIIDFAAAAPVLVQEKRQACVDVVHIPRDAITVSGKRGDEELQKFAQLLEENFKTWRKPVESSDAHASSSSVPLGPDHGSTNVVQAPAPNPASSTANPNPMMEPSSPSSKASPALSDSEEYEWLYELEDDDKLHGPLYTPTSSGHGLDHELSSPPPGPNHGSTNVVQAPAPNPALSTANPNPLTGPWDPSPTVLESSANPNPLTEPWDPSSIAFESPKPLTESWDLSSIASESSANPNPLTEPWDPSSIAHSSPNPLTEPWDPSSIAHSSPNPLTEPWDPSSIAHSSPNPSMEPWDPSSIAFESPEPSTKPWDPSSILVYDSPSLSDSEEYKTSHEFEGGNSDESHGPLYTQTSSGDGLDHELTKAHVPQLNPKKRPWTDPDWPGPDFDWNYWIDLEDPPPKKPALSKEFDQANEYQVEHLQQPDPGPPTDFDSNYYPVLDPGHPPFTSAGLLTEPEYNVPRGQPPNPELTDPYYLDHQSLSTDSQPVDPRAAIYATKGRAKESRRISRTARDVGNAAQRKLQPDERSLDPRE